MTREDAKKLLNKLYARADITDEYGDMEDMEPYEKAVDMAVKALEQQPCEDAISRRDAIDAMYSLCGDGTLKENEWRDNPHIDSIIDALNDLPSVSTEKTRWIPVSERLPGIHNYCMKYLVTDRHRHIHTSLFTESRGKCWWSHEDVIAWMPLPQPYKGESEGRE